MPTPVSVCLAALLALDLGLHGAQPRRLLLVVQALQVIVAKGLAGSLLSAVRLHLLRAEGRDEERSVVGRGEENRG